MHAQTSYDLLEKKRCAELFPNVVIDYLARSECISAIDKRVEKQKSEERAAEAKQRRETAARSCIADDIARIERLLDSIKTEINADFESRSNNSVPYKLGDVQSLLREKWPSNYYSIQASENNIREKVLVFKIKTNCDSEFDSLSNVRADANDELQWYRLWIENAPKGYEVTYNKLNKWGIDFVALKKEKEYKLIIVKLGLPGWTQDSYGCKLWNTVPNPNETVTWTGGCKDGFADGFGTITWKTDNVVTQITKLTLSKGRETDGPADVYIVKTGIRNIGNQVNGFFEGPITVTKYEKPLYNGTVKSSKFDGMGTLYLSDNTKYVGSFVNNKKEGYGKIIDSDGRRIYEGSFVDNKKNGNGNYFYKSGDWYSGTFADDLFSGSGTINYVNGGTKYVSSRDGCAWLGSELIAWIGKSPRQCKLERGMPAD